MKTCSRCKKLLDKSAFYSDKRTPSGLKSQCKSCHTEGNLRTRDPENSSIINRRYMREARKRNPELFRERERVASRKRVWDKKREARYQLNLAVRRGDLVRPSLCSQCGSSGKITAHHTDYSKPLEVIWLCYVCHGNQ